MAGAGAHQRARVRGEGILIFVTVGGQLPFDRLIRAVDAWAVERGRGDLEAQIGRAEFEPKHIAFQRFLSPQEFRKTAERADAIVAHAGMGTILLALELGKPLLVMPRRAARGEHRNDHQVATARIFAEQGLVLAAGDERELRDLLEDIESLPVADRIAPQASAELIHRIREVALTPRG